MNVNAIDVRSASKLWNLSETTIKRKCQRGEVRAVKLGGIWLIDPNQRQPVDERRSKDGS